MTALAGKAGCRAGRLRIKRGGDVLLSKTAVLRCGEKLVLRRSLGLVLLAYIRAAS